MMDRRGRARSFRRVASPGVHVEVETRWVRCGLEFFFSDDHLTTDPRTFLYSILYSKKAAVEAYTPPRSVSRPHIYTAAIQPV